MSNNLTVEQATVEAQKALLEGGEKPFKLKNDLKDQVFSKMKNTSSVLSKISFYEMSDEEIKNKETKDLLAETWLPLAVLQDACERGDVGSTVADLLGQRSSLDIEELILCGYENSDDPYLAMLDGLIARAEQRDDLSDLETAVFFESAATRANDDDICPVFRMDGDRILAVEDISSVSLGFDVAAVFPVMAKDQHVAIRFQFFVLFSIGRAKTYIKSIKD